MRILLLASLCGFLVAQQPQQSQPQQPAAQQGNTQTFSTTLRVVQAPVTVYDRAGNYVNNLQPSQFRLYDNNKEQNIHSVDVTYTPISLVIAIQANARVEKILPQVNRIGSMLKPIILGDAGEAAVVAFDSRVRTLQEFTSDPDKIEAAVKSLKYGGSSSRLNDAVEASDRLLSSRNKDRRRILLVIGEKRDSGSEARPREVAINLQLHNITTYWVDMSHVIGILTASAPDPRPDNRPPAMHPMPAGVPATPTTVDQMYGTNGGSAQFIPLMVEFFKDVKHIFGASQAELYTRGTGGAEYSFTSQKTLEQAIQGIGEELHSQYLVSYTPNNSDEYGWHQLAVSIVGKDYRCQTRPGYWWAITK